MNKVSLVGRLTREPETRYSQSATPTAVTRIGIAVNRPYAKEGEQKADFFNGVSFGKRAEFIEKYGKKGRLVALVGRLQQNAWESPDGIKHSTIEVVIEEINFLDKQEAAAGEAGSESATPSTPNFADEDDDLPF